MRRIFLFGIPLFALLLAGLLWSQQSFMQDPAWVGSLTSGAAGCETDDTILPHDTLLEGFQGGYENVWSETGTVANIDDAADTSLLAAGKPTGACDVGYYIVDPTDGNETYSTWDNVSTITNSTSVNTIFYLWIKTALTLSKAYMVAGAGEGATAITSRWLVELSNAGGQHRIRAYSSAGSSGYANVATSTWLKVLVHSDGVDANSYVEVNDQGATNTFTAQDKNLRYWHIGMFNSLDAGDGGELYFDLICVDQP